jgi:hypothetical protein
MDLLGVISKYAPVGTIVAASCAFFNRLCIKLDTVGFYNSLGIYWKVGLVPV